MDWSYGLVSTVTMALAEGSSAAATTTNPDVDTLEANTLPEESKAVTVTVYVTPIVYPELESTAMASDIVLLERAAEVNMVVVCEGELNILTCTYPSLGKPQNVHVTACETLPNPHERELKGAPMLTCGAAAGNDRHPLAKSYGRVYGATTENTGVDTVGNSCKPREAMVYCSSVAEIDKPT